MLWRVEKIRLSKWLSDRGHCSRREADGWIERGWVRVDGVPAILGLRIDPGQQVVIDPRAKRASDALVTLLLHKPIGYVSGQPEKGYLPAVSLIRPDNAIDDDRALFQPRHLRGLAPAGRLDIDSQGLLVLTQDGRVARALLAGHTIEKEYLVRVSGRLSPSGLALLRHGLSLDGHTLRPAQVAWANRDQLRFVLTEGRKRQIRRMCEAVDLTVTGLKRVRIGQVRLGSLPPGRFRYLRPEETF